MTPGDITPSRVGPFIGGSEQPAQSYVEVKSPYDGQAIAEVGLGTADDLERAIAQASAAFESFSHSATHERALLLERIALALDAESDALAELITRESGKPIRYARAEVARSATTFRIGAAEARSFGGEVLPSDQLAGAEGRLTLWKRVPKGVVAGISPFNFPLNLVAHKLAPAFAVGAPLLLKPAPQAPLTAHRLAEIAARAGAPPDTFNVLHLEPRVAERLASDPRLPVLSFTGSDTVGWHLAGVAQKKRVLLELGGNAPAVVDETCDLERALSLLVDASFASAGQVCIKAQRIYVHAARFAEFVERFVALSRELVVGDPLDPRTVVGPMIEAKHVARVRSWVAEAEAAGARKLSGGGGSGNLLEPIVLTDTKPELRVCRDEIFGPVCVIEPVASFEAGLLAANQSRFGIQAAVFTSDLGRALSAFETLDYPGVLVNDAPSFRVDNVPYGGVRDSGLGREGVRFAMEEYSDPKLLSLRR